MSAHQARNLVVWISAGLILGGAFMVGWALGRDVISPWINSSIEKEADHE